MNTTFSSVEHNPDLSDQQIGLDLEAPAPRPRRSILIIRDLPSPPSWLRRHRSPPPDTLPPPHTHCHRRYRRYRRHGYRRSEADV